jgi:hypothetical protein
MLPAHPWDLSSCTHNTVLRIGFQLIPTLQSPTPLSKHLLLATVESRPVRPGLHDTPAGPLGPARIAKGTWYEKSNGSAIIIINP